MILVAGEDDLGDGGTGEHRDAEVRDRPREVDAVDELGPRVGAVAAGRIAVARDLALATERVFAV